MSDRCPTCGQTVKPPKRCCETCAHWAHIGCRQNNGSCRAPVPVGLPEWIDAASRSRKRTAGRDCPAWKLLTGERPKW